jgi:glycopeptide antibiotics resistance protein
LEYWSIAAARITFEKQLCSFAYLLLMRVFHVRLDARLDADSNSYQLNISLSPFSLSLSLSLSLSPLLLRINLFDNLLFILFAHLQ